ncbi:MAG: response regulator transcription factor [Candidatus Bipolaricaulota bacterium]|nr:response regulator transcription factor [Candidatus Bipolaricaulota bacterium]
MGSIRVVLGDDHALVRSGIRALLASSGVEVVAEAGDGRSLLREVRAHRPDVALVDVSMPLLDGIEATRRIARLSPQTGVVILTMHDDRSFVARARRAGARAYVVKDSAVERLLDVVHRVAAGETCLVDDGEPLDEPLTSREREVLQLVVEGKKNGEIAELLHRSIHTVRNHRARLMRKLGARSAADLVAAAERLGVAVGLPGSGRG